MSLYGRDLLKIMDYSEVELRLMLDTAKEFKRLKQEGKRHDYLCGKNIALLFEKTSTRTRCAFEVAAYDLGMHVTYLDPSGSQMGHKESIADTSRVLDRYFDGIEFRGFAQKTVEELARYAKHPVWNGLTDYCHPTQVLADFMTIEEHFGTAKGLTLAFVGDTRNNISNSLMAMSAKMGTNIIICGPSTLAPDPKLVEKCKAVAKKNGSTIKVTTKLSDITNKADIIYTDVWLSLGEPKEKWRERIDLLSPYQITSDVMSLAKPNAVFMHALPSFHNQATTVAQDIFEQFGIREMEVTDEVFESDRSIVFDEAENRMHTIKATMYLTLNKKEN